MDQKIDERDIENYKTLFAQHNSYTKQEQTSTKSYKYIKILEI